ncbi:ABC transporter permease [Paenibacillus terrigena]|uniref:ABC transporter permease n=1 Tax=Paenibacillus terrigena TaxID=369333 RepID=UPI0003827B52|nr:ABC transporter permease [Paenibacillus terrigena]
MTFRELAIHNIKGNWHRYGAYFWSSVFSVMVFFIYASFLNHPDIVHGVLRAVKSVKNSLIVCQVIVMVFSFFFVLYAITSFIRTRKKEFGLFSLCGMTSGQLKWMILLENMLISTLAILVGIVFGLMFSKLFYMGIGVLLGSELPLRFAVSMKAVLQTALGFTLLFLTITVYSILKVGRAEIIELIQASRQPKKPPMASKWLLLVTVLSLGGCYYMAYIMSAQTALVFFMPIMTLVMIGTYFLYTQGSVAILNRLQRSRRISYHGTNLVTLGQLLFKVKDNARVLFMVSILSAVVLTASSTAYIMDRQTYAQFKNNFPQTYSYMEQGLNTHQVANPQDIVRVLQESGHTLSYKLHTAGFKVRSELLNYPGERSEQDNFVISARDYNEAVSHKGKQSIQVEKDHAALVLPFDDMGAYQAVQPGEVVKSIRSDGKPLILTVDEQRSGSPFSRHSGFSQFLVMNTEQHDAVMQGIADQDKFVNYALEVKEWETITDQTNGKVMALVKEEATFDNRSTSYLDVKQTSGIMIFVGIFVSLLFVIATGSILYFRLFTEIEEDREHYRALARMGMTVMEMKRVVNAQVGILFFLPCIVGLIHSAFAMKALGNLLFISTWGYASIVAGIFIGVQFVYFVAAKRNYLRRVMGEL